MTVLQSETKNSWTASTKHPTSMVQLSSFYYRLPVLFGKGLLKMLAGPAQLLPWGARGARLASTALPVQRVGVVGCGQTRAQF